MQLFVRGQTLHSVHLNGSETVAHIKVFLFVCFFLIAHIFIYSSFRKLECENVLIIVINCLFSGSDRSLGGSGL